MVAGQADQRRDADPGSDRLNEIGVGKTAQRHARALRHMGEPVGQLDLGRPPAEADDTMIFPFLALCRQAEALGI